MNEIEEFLKVEYELNEKQHDTKEHVIWLAFGLYYAYAIGFIQFIVNSRHYLIFIKSKSYIILIDLFIFLLSSTFIIMQCKRKYISVFKTKELKYLIGNYNSESIKKWFLYDQKVLENRLWKENKSNILYTSRFEIVLYLIMLLLYITKIIIICNRYGNHLIFKECSYLFILSIIYYVVILIFVYSSYKN